MNRLRNRLPVALLVIPAVCALNCLNPFAPKLDTGSAVESCSDLTLIDNIFCTFRNAYTFKDTTLYGRILAPGFNFIYTDYDRGVDVTWGRTDEIRSTYGLFQSVQSLTLIWNNQISESGDDTLRTIVRGFNLTVAFNPSDITRVSGYANMTFVRRTAEEPWKILRWRDESNF